MKVETTSMRGYSVADEMNVNVKRTEKVVNKWKWNHWTMGRWRRWRRHNTKCRLKMIFFCSNVAKFQPHLTWRGVERQRLSAAIHFVFEIFPFSYLNWKNAQNDARPRAQANILTEWESQECIREMNDSPPLEIIYFNSQNAKSIFYLSLLNTETENQWEYCTGARSRILQRKSAKKKNDFLRLFRYSLCDPSAKLKFMRWNVAITSCVLPPPYLRRSPVFFGRGARECGR